MFKNQDTKGTRLAIWVSSILRWVLGAGFLVMGYAYHQQDYAWVLFVFGTLLIVTGFLRPKRCVQDRCEIDKH